MLTIYLDGQAARGLVDMTVDITIFTEMEVIHFPHWKFRLGLPISGVGGPQDSKLTNHLVH